jgi:hypothetical protein
MNNPGDGVREGPVSPIGSSHGRLGSSPALLSWPGAGSMTSGVPKQSRTCGQAAGILSAGVPRQDILMKDEQQ